MYLSSSDLYQNQQTMYLTDTLFVGLGAAHDLRCFVNHSRT